MHSASELERAYFEYKSFDSAMGQAEERDGRGFHSGNTEPGSIASLGQGPKQRTRPPVGQTQQLFCPSPTRRNPRTARARQRNERASDTP